MQMIGLDTTWMGLYAGCDVTIKNRSVEALEILNNKGFYVNAIIIFLSVDR